MRRIARRNGAFLGAALLGTASILALPTMAQTPLQNLQAVQQQQLLNQSAAGLAASRPGQVSPVGPTVQTLPSL
ncbi:MAG: hypothetical protein JWP04_1110, partial [Belnapia sp.]|nr:hypothetical protein [Belnapia sp.]